MDSSEAGKRFTVMLRDFCRAHRTGRRTPAEFARVALDWELELNARIAERWPNQPAHDLDREPVEAETK